LGGGAAEYFLCKNLFGAHTIGKWIICELESVASTLSDLVDEENLLYVNNVKNLSVNIDFAIISGTLQYLPDPFAVLEDILRLEPKYILITKTPFWERSTRLTKQLSWKHQGYSKRQKYPFWILNEADVMDIFVKKGYRKLLDNLGQNMYVTEYGFLRYRSVFLSK
jgi:putative methyltransferase (TIGR04325 family)